MRLFILQKTPLERVSRLTPSPKPGDILVYLRLGQDPNGNISQDLRDKGIVVEYGETIVPMETSRAMDDLGGKFLRTWFTDNGQDISKVWGVSLGDNQVQYMGKMSNPRFVVRIGEIARIYSERYPEAGIVSDISDGDGIIASNPAYFPVGTIIKHVAQTLGRSYEYSQAINPLPEQMFISNKDRLLPAIKAYLGGFRISWIRHKLRWKLHRTDNDEKPLFYVFNGRGSNMVADGLVETGDFRAAVGSDDSDKAFPLRHDHFFALPSPRVISQAFLLWRHAKKLPDQLESNKTFAFHGINYGPVLARPLAAMFGATLLSTLIILAQTRKLMQKTKAKGYIINGEGNGMSFLAALTRKEDVAVYYLKHGINVNTRTLRSDHLNESHITYLSCGADHRAEFGRFLHERNKPRCAIVGNQLTAITEPIKGRRPAIHKKRLLIISFGNLAHYRGSRVTACDQYIVTMFGLTKKLASEGWSISYRGHPGHPLALEKRLAADMGVSKIIHWDTQRSFFESLLAHDVVVCSNSSVYYQALYAGWPCVFYEPDYLPKGNRDELFTLGPLIGLPIAKDISRPVTSSPETLGRLVRDTVDPHSFSSRFPEILMEQYAERFFGPNPIDPISEVVRVIRNDAVRSKPIEAGTAT